MRLSSTVRFNLFIFLILALLTGYAGCGGRDLAGDAKSLLARWFGPKTPRTKYRKTAREELYISERDLELWDAVYQLARSTPLTVTLPHRELMNVDTALTHSAQAFRFILPPGRYLTLRALHDAPYFFGELFRLNNGQPTKRPQDWFTSDIRELTYKNTRNQPLDLLFVAQAAAYASTRFEVQITTAPIIGFPVSGKDESAIQSFWGAARDGGKRKHEGNDIFAPKGTELLAVVEGTISRVSNGGLGGKTVWLKDPETGLRYYYAHLDEQLVGQGQYVSRGQVVGTVGNTGNARTTPPHLHFGIYDGGAIDPYPFLERDDKLPAASPLNFREPGQSVTVPNRGNHYLRLAPEREGTKVRQLENGEAVTALGVSGRFWRVMTGRGEVGYANFD